jgi:hypothetical protein
VRCDNAPAPWSSEDVGDAPRELPAEALAEIKRAEGGPVYQMTDSPYW